MHGTVIFLQVDLLQKDGFSPLAKFVAPAGQKLGPIPETLTAVVMDLASSFTRRNYKKISTDRAHRNVLALVLAGSLYACRCCKVGYSRRLWRIEGLSACLGNCCAISSTSVHSCMWTP